MRQNLGTHTVDCVPTQEQHKMWHFISMSETVLHQLFVVFCLPLKLNPLHSFCICFSLLCGYSRLTHSQIHIQIIYPHGAKREAVAQG